jgi:hypothetical protein
LGAVEECSARFEAGEAYKAMGNGSADQAEAGASDPLSRTLPDAGSDVDSTTSACSPSEIIYVELANTDGIHLASAHVTSGFKEWSLSLGCPARTG